MSAALLLFLAGLAGCSSSSSPPECPAGKVKCNGSCVDLQSNQLHCGACGTLCSATQLCTSGACASICPDGELSCGDTCADPLTDALHCGASGDCKGANAGVACQENQPCQAGTCLLVCSGNQVACGGACVDPQTDAAWCGASGSCTGAQAGSACAAGSTCVAGACRLSCPVAQVSCGGACVDPSTDPTWCGASGDCTGATAGTRCTGGTFCRAGACALPCRAGKVTCGGACVDPQTNPAYCGASGDCTGIGAGTACTATQGCLAGTCVAACAPVPLDLDTPFETATPPFNTRPGQQVPSGFWGSSAAPLPTNASWENLVLGGGGNRVDLLPYQVKAETDWLAVGNGAPVASTLAAWTPDQVQLRLGALKTGSFSSHKVTAYDLLSVTLLYTAAGGTMTAPIVEGMPYVTVDYAGLRPMLQAGSAFSSVNGATAAGAATGTRFKVQLSDGTTWLVYTSAPVTFDWNSSTMSARSAMTGTLRVANASDAASIAALDAYAGAVPTGGSVAVGVGCDQATLRFTYTTRGTGQLLMAALPHHLARLSTYSTTGLTFNTLRGTLLGVVGSNWELKLPLTTTGWQAPRPVAAAHLEAVRAALLADASFTPDARVGSDPYFGGKLLAKLARLALIADELGEATTATALRARLAPLAAAWLEHTNGNPLVYDTTWGGVVTTNGLANPSIDFGQGYYNDHHYHYGYHLYAAAALIKGDSTFATTQRWQALLALVRDIANPSATDPKFPRLRHMDLFRGHSWASGLHENIDGRDQESSSEAVNAWYGLHLLGLASGDARMSDLGRVLLALETDSARTYWQVTDPSAIYQSPFAQNRCVGRLYQTKVTFDTFFDLAQGANPEFVYGIQMLPYTPASEALLSPAWITNAWPTMAARTAGATQEWAGLLTMAHATIAREAAWTDATALTAWDDGNSKTNTLWWIATRP